MPNAEAIALVGVEGTASTLERHVRDLRTMVSAPLEVRDGSRAQQAWNTLRDLPDKACLRVRIGAKPHDLPGLLAACGPCLGRWVRAGHGIAWLHLDPQAGAAERIARWQEKASGGYAVAESAPLDLPARDRLPWGMGSQPLMRSIKEAWDPARILAPGRIAL
jgi:hypothetical protein